MMTVFFYHNVDDTFKGHAN